MGDTLEFKLLKRDRRAIIAGDARAQEATSKKMKSLKSSQAGSKPSRQSRDGNKPQTAWQSGAEANESTEKADLPILERLKYNHFSKFTQIEDAPLLWREAAETLAGYASEVDASLC